jgi:hypothetical protein
MRDDARDLLAFHTFAPRLWSRRSTSAGRRRIERLDNELVREKPGAQAVGSILGVAALPREMRGAHDNELVVTATPEASVMAWFAGVAMNASTPSIREEPEKARRRR